MFRWFETKPSGPIYDLLATATDSRNAEVDWVPAYAVLEQVQESPEGPSLAAKAIRFLLFSSDPVVASNTIDVLNMFMTNGPQQLKLEYIKPDFQKNYSRFIDRQASNRENIFKLLFYIGSWLDKLEDPLMSEELGQYCSSLASKGIRIPRSAQETVFVTEGTSNIPDRSSSIQVDPARVDHDVETTMSQIQVFDEALNFADPDQDLSTNEVIQEFYAQLVKSRDDIANVIPRIMDDTIVAKLIGANEAIAGAINRYQNALDQRNVEKMKKISEREYEAEAIQKQNEMRELEQVFALDASAAQGSQGVGSSGLGSLGIDFGAGSLGFSSASENAVGSSASSQISPFDSSYVSVTKEQATGTPSGLGSSSSPNTRDQRVIAEEFDLVEEFEGPPVVSEKMLGKRRAE
ncbi:uncharacterized protein BJ171DRAFT_517828 [Polychytrium aggregatum]|uniref:uncharacterized protein n=1 Tax=Polychytrium aggregatum TaxID=110093 RepID=UPI0022FE8143|nr:uncharacterized protein BJ171DRAFT_517828 [Polychytrium aggregatum]KAI9199526.1 hypothetical protein BJ171DRAFT_517828 [Polychytrium aggregatum]